MQSPPTNRQRRVSHTKTTPTEGGCQFQRLVSQYFFEHARVVAKWPLPFLVGPILLTVALLYGLVVNAQNLHNTGLDPMANKLAMFLPDDTPALRNLHTLTEYFPPRHALRDNYDMFGATFAYVIVEDISEKANVLRDYPLLVANDLHKRVSAIDIAVGDRHRASFDTLCYRLTDGQCMLHPIMYLLNSSRPMESVKYFLGYPYQTYGVNKVDNALTFGTVETETNSTTGIRRLTSARAMRIVYFLRQPIDAVRSELSAAWQNSFVALLSSLQYPGIQLYFTSSVSWGQEVERNGEMILPFMPLLFVVLIIFSWLACLSNDCVVSKPTLGLCGIANALFAVVATISTLVIVGYPFLQMVFIMPFLIMSISVDNMFLMLNSWRSTHAALPLEERMARSVGETSVSILITALTDGLSFSVGSISAFPAVRVFCTYCALACLFVFVYQMTFFTACMALCGRREQANRHCITLCKVSSREEADPGEWWMYSLLCLGGTGSRRSLPCHAPNSTGYVTRFFRDTYAQLLNIGVVKAVSMLAYVLYIGQAVYGVLQLPIGLNLALLVPADSYLRHELLANTRHFSAYGGYAYAVTTGTDLDYSNVNVRQHLLHLYDNLTRTHFTSEGEFWLADMERVYKGRTFRRHDHFLEAVRAFLARPEMEKYNGDVHYDDESGRIDASKMLVRMRNVGFANHSLIARTLHAVFAEAHLPGFVYESTFMLVEQQEATVDNVVTNVLFAVLVMLLISLLFMPRLLTALWIGASILSINLGVMAGLALWDVHLDIVSMITIVMSIGFSVDFAAHVTYHFLMAKGGPQRLNDALGVVAVPILQAAGSTVVGVLSLAPVESYMVRTFVKTVVLVVSLGLLHALLFLPVALSLLVPASHHLQALDVYGRIGQYLTNRFGHGRVGDGGGKKRMQAYEGHTGMDDVVSVSHRRVVGGLHDNKRYPTDTLACRPQARASTRDLHTFLQFKQAQMEAREEMVDMSEAETTTAESVSSAQYTDSTLPTPSPIADSMMTGRPPLMPRGVQLAAPPRPRRRQRSRGERGEQQHYASRTIDRRYRSVSTGRSSFPPPPKTMTVRIALGQTSSTPHLPTANEHAFDSDWSEVESDGQQHELTTFGRHLLGQPPPPPHHRKNSSLINFKPI